MKKLDIKMAQESILNWFQFIFPPVTSKPGGFPTVFPTWRVAKTFDSLIGEHWISKCRVHLSLTPRFNSISFAVEIILVAGLLDFCSCFF